VAAYGQVGVDDADVIVALGGDGFMLTVLQWQLERIASGKAPKQTYGVNFGTLGFLLNRSFNDRDDALLLPERVALAEPVELTPLRAVATLADGRTWTRWAFNEVALRRSGPQSACLSVAVDGRPRLPRLAGDGLIVATPAGSAAYNYSAGGPVLPLSANAHALTAICPISPRRWPGAVLPAAAQVRVEVLERDKRPVSISADTHEADGVVSVDIFEDPTMSVDALFDAGHDLDERLLAVQFGG
jgi:NAD+ kinase